MDRRELLKKSALLTGAVVLPTALFGRDWFAGEIPATRVAPPQCSDM